jgi:hypothetical protein
MVVHGKAPALPVNIRLGCKLNNTGLSSGNNSLNFIFCDFLQVTLSVNIVNGHHLQPSLIFTSKATIVAMSETHKGVWHGKQCQLLYSSVIYRR